MKLNLKYILLASALLVGIIFTSRAFMSSSCCSTTSESTSGCTPSSCRGAQTKFGEAKVITSLRADLISLKAEMEKSENPVFEERSYDIHGIVGDSDEESLQIIIDELEIIETAFEEKLDYTSDGLNLPDNNAGKVKYISERIGTLQALL